MTGQELLNELETLSYVERWERMVALGRQNTPDVQIVIKELETGDFYQRFLALQLCGGSRDAEHVLRTLFNDPSTRLRALATSLVPQLCSDEQVVAALNWANAKISRAILSGLKKLKRQAAIDLYLNQVSDNQKLVRLLGYATPELVAKHLNLLEEQADVHDWTRLAKNLPEQTAQILTAKAKQLQHSDYRLLSYVNHALPHIALLKPTAALELVKAMLGQFSLAQMTIQPLVTELPEEVAQLLLTTTEQASLNFDTVLPRLKTETILALLTKHGNSIGQSFYWLKKLNPEQRRQVYELSKLGWRDSETGSITTDYIEKLPSDLREFEARRNLALPAFANKPNERLQYAAYLGWDEARQILEPYIGDPDPILRVVAHETLGTLTRYHRSRLPELLKIIRGRRNEQDPIRLAMITGLASMPPSAFKTEQLEDLGQIVREALNAADLSYSTARQLEFLILRLLPFHPQWSSQWFATLLKERGRIYSNLSQYLTDQQVTQITPTILPILRSWVTRESESHLVSFARNLNRRIEFFPELIDIIVELIPSTKDSGVASRLLALLKEHKFDRLHTLIPELLAQDQSWIMLDTVYNYLDQTRQNLLTPFLGQTKFEGRYTTGKTYTVLPLGSYAYRWTAKQQAIFVQILSRVTGDDTQDSPSISSVIYQLSELPSVPPTRLIELTSDERPAVRDIAIKNLGMLDNFNLGAQALLEMMGDDRARVAIYALRHAMLETPPTQAFATLATIPLNKITVAKEVVRLLGELKIEVAYTRLLEIEADKNLHRDVRVAVLRGLWNYLELDQTWLVLNQAAINPDPAIAIIVSRIPTDRLSNLAQQRLAQLLAVLLKHPDGRVRLKVLQRCYELPINDPTKTLRPALLAALSSDLPAEYEAASSAIVVTYSKQDAGLVSEAVLSILKRRRTLQTFIEKLWSQAAQIVPTIRAIISVMASDPILTTSRLQLAILSFGKDEIVQVLREMAGKDELHELATTQAATIITNHLTRLDLADLEDLEKQLADSPNPKLRYFALAALQAQAEAPHGWNDARIARLNQYRLDPSVLVASVAQFTFVPGEI